MCHNVIQMLPLAPRTLHTPCLHRWQRAGVMVVLVVLLVLVLVLLVLQWHAHLHLQRAHLNLRRYRLRRQPVELRVVHWGYRANLLPGVPARYAVHAAEGEMAALHLLLLLPHDHRLRLQRVKGAV